MSDYILSCGSATDLNPKLCEEMDIHYICFNFEIGGVAYKDDLGVSLSYHEFYDMIRDGQKTRTSQINAQEYEEYFAKFLKQGKDVLHVELSSGLTGTMNSATLAVNSLKEQYPNNKVILVDSLAGSLGYGLLVQKVAEKKKEGLSIEQLAKWVEENRLRVNHIFCSTDLSTFIAGGRISPAAGFIGQALGVCPLIEIDTKGKLFVGEKIRTRKKALKKVVEMMLENADNASAYNDELYVGHSDCLEEAQMLKEIIEENFPNLVGKIPVGYIGTTIGSHTGSGTCGVVFWGKGRVENND